MSKEPDPVVEKLYGLLEEAVELRHGTANDPEGKLVLPQYHEGPTPFVNVLLRARQRADRVEELLSSAKHVRQALLRVQREASDAAQDKLDEALVAGQATKAEYSTGMERRAEASLKSFAEKRAEREASRRVDAANHVVDALKDIHWGLSGLREDIRTILRTYQFESNLER